MVQRTRTIISYLYDNFLDDFDFFHFSGDDVYLIVENLKEFLSSDFVKDYDKVPNQYLFAGFSMKHGYARTNYLGGGSGYTMSRKMLRAFVEGPLQLCCVDFEGSAEDVIISDCAKVLNANSFIDTRDLKGAHRYHQLPVQRHATFPNTSWGISTRLIQQSLEYQEKEYGYPVVYKDAYISNSSVAFHKLSPAEMRRLEILLYLNISEVCGKMEV
jgi:glycoprotein-N-acetylgalactosamine 3-beta-galactosyltransferase